MTRYAMNDQVLCIGHNLYDISHMKDIYVIKHTQRQQWLRQFRLGALFALGLGLASVPLGPTAFVVATTGFVIGVIYGLSSSERIVLQARFLATDETGDQVVPLLTATNDNQLEIVMQLYCRLKPKMKELQQPS